MVNKKIFITGGAGYLGRNLIERFYGDNEITVYSRDEAKHYYLKKQFPNVRFIVGDVRNYDLLYRASKNHNIGIFAASLKQIEACNDHYEEANKVIVEGAFNSRRVAEEHNYEAACFISSDKSRAATTIYGAMKFVAGESFIVNAAQSSVRLSTAIYGNVTNSTGSIIPLIWKTIAQGASLTLYGSEMTRFMLDIDDAMDLIEKSLELSGVNTVPIAKSFYIRDLFEIYHEDFGLCYTVTEPRSGEKIHEIMISEEETRRTMLDVGRNIYLISQMGQNSNVTFPRGEYSSRDCCITKQQLREYLQQRNYYQG